MANEMTELKIDMGLIAHYGNADYIDGDMVVLDGIDKVLQGLTDIQEVLAASNQ